MNKLMGHKRLLYSVSVILFVVLVFIIFRIFSPKQPGYTFKITGIPTSNKIGFINDNMYSYNGLAFFKTSTNVGKTSQLTKPLNLPDIDKISWGKDGAIVIFKNYSGNDQVGQYINTKGLGSNPIRFMYWYISYDSGSIELIQSSTTVISSVLYSVGTNLFYVTTGNIPGKYVDQFTYNPMRRTLSRIKHISDFYMVDNVFLCGDSLACVSGVNKEGRAILYSISSEQTNNLEIPYSRFILNTTNVGSVVAKYQLYNLETKEIETISKSINTANNSIAFSEGHIVLVGETPPEPGQLIYYSGTNDKGIRLSKKVFSSSIMPADFIYFDQGIGVLSFNDSYISMKRDGINQNKLSLLEDSPDFSKLRSCSTLGLVEGVNSREQTITVESINSQTQISNCLLSSGIKPYTYHVSFDLINTQRPIKP